MKRASFVSKRGVYQVRVVYQDTDQARVVHHASYFRYLEAARIEFWRGNGWSYDQFEKDTGLGLPVVEAHLRYRSSARFDDLLEIHTWVSEASRASVWFEGEVRRDGVVLVETRVRLACASFDDAKLRHVPAGLLDACLSPGYVV